MSDSVIAPIIAGLVIGIAFVVMFSAISMPDFMLSDKDLVAKYSHLTQVEHFLEKYPEAKTKVFRNSDVDYIEIIYSVERQIESASDGYTGTNIFGIHVYVEPDQLSFGLSCGVVDGATIGWGFEDIDVIDGIEKHCFHIDNYEEVPEPDNSGNERNEIDPLTFGSGFFDCCFRHQQLTIAVNAVDGNSLGLRNILGLRQAIEVEPVVIDEYPLLQDMIEEAGRIETEELVIVYRNISGTEADFLTDGRLAFVRTCFEMVCYDEVSSFINLGSETSYVIRVYEADNNDPFVPDDGSDGETGVFEHETGVGEPISVEVSDDNDTSIEITYEED